MVFHSPSAHFSHDLLRSSYALWKGRFLQRCISRARLPVVSSVIPTHVMNTSAVHIFKRLILLKQTKKYLHVYILIDPKTFSCIYSFQCSSFLLKSLGFILLSFVFILRHSISCDAYLLMDSLGWLSICFSLPFWRISCFQHFWWELSVVFITSPYLALFLQGL